MYGDAYAMAVNPDRADDGVLRIIGAGSGRSDSQALQEFAKFVSGRAIYDAEARRFVVRVHDRMDRSLKAMDLEEEVAARS